MKKQFLFHLVAVAIVVISILLLGEIIIRIEGFIKGGHIWTPDKYFYVQHIPNTRFRQIGYKREYITRGRIDRWGFVGDGCTLRKGDDTYRIIALGDSMTEAVHVDMDKNFCSRLDSLLNGGSERFEVINAGLSDFSPKLEYLYLKERLLRFNPDYLFVQLAANDVYDDYKFKDIRGPSTSLPVNRSFIYNHSRFYHYVKRQLAKLTKKLTKTREPKYSLGVDSFFFIKQGKDDLKRELWAATEQHLRGIKKIADQQGVGLTVFAIPLDAEIMSFKEMSPISKAYFKKDATDDFNKAVVAFCKAQNIDYIDMTPRFRDNKKMSLHYAHDCHLTEQGHALVADILYKHLKDKL
jgi:lysophospholipase L1-like esterase